MATVNDIFAHKDRKVLSIAPKATVLDAAVMMNAHKIGCLLVMEGRRICGIVTERDILRKVVAVRADPAATPVDKVMTREVIYVRPETGIEEARGMLKSRRIRHLPVIDSSRQVCGMISIGDLNAFEIVDKEITIHFLHEYLYGADLSPAAAVKQ